MTGFNGKMVFVIHFPPSGSNTSPSVITLILTSRMTLLLSIVNDVVFFFIQL
jgi:hypothetical protein